MQKIKVVLDWFANTNHAGFYIALKTDEYKKANLEVELIGEVHGEMKVGNNDIVVCPQPALLTGIEDGTKLTAVATLTQKNDSGIVSLKHSKITSPKKLMGKKLSHWKPNWFHSVLKRVVEQDGGEYSSVILVQKDIGNIEEGLTQYADATWIYKNWEYFVMNEAGYELNYFNLAQIDPLLDFCAPCVCATHRMIEERPDVLHDFLRITEKGYQKAAENPAVAAAVMVEEIPFASMEMIEKSQRYLSDLFLDERGNWGWMNPKRWEPFADWMVEQALIEKRTQREYTNEFLSR